MNMKFVTGAVLTALLLPGLAMAQTNTRATFAVTKIFADGNIDAEVTVTIDCNTGIILDQDKTLGHGDFVEFVVTDFTNDILNCTIEEEDGPSGYTATYEGNGNNPAVSECSWIQLADGAAGVCEITNRPDEVSIVVNKHWIITGDNDVNLGYRLRTYCSSIFIEPEQNDGGGSAYRIGTQYGDGPGSGSHIFKVAPAWPSSSCWVEERVYDSAIEVNDENCVGLTVSAGNGASCTITNTVFFEGIPTLSQYGMAIMALLMLGVGFVGFRRFV